jgi:hypothetical protein
MIIKSIAIKDRLAFGRLIDYVRRDNAALKNRDGKIVEIRHNVFGAPNQIIQQFKENEAQRIHKRSNNNVLYHIVLSLSGEDEVTPEMMERLTREYIGLMNQDALYYCTIHMSEGNKNPHSHTLMSGVAAGKSVRISREEFKQAKIDLENKVRELYPHLIHSEVDHGKGGRGKSDKEWQIENKGRTSRHREVSELATASFELATSRDEFVSLLAEDGLKTYVRHNEVVGVEDDYNFRFENLGLDLSVLDERESRMVELGMMQEEKIQEVQQDEELTVEEQRLRELEELDKDNDGRAV